MLWKSTLITQEMGPGYKLLIHVECETIKKQVKNNQKNESSDENCAPF